MDRKSLIIVIISFVLLLAWFPLMNKLYPPKPVAHTNQVVTITNQPQTATTQATAAVQPAPDAIQPVPVASSSLPERLETVEVDGVRYTFTTHGGGLKQVELVHYPEVVERKRQPGAKVKGVVLNRAAPAPVMALAGPAMLVEDGYYQLSRTGDVIVASKKLTNGVLITKEFRPASNYLMEVTVRLENQSGADIPLPAQKWITGTASPISEQDDLTTVGVFVYDGQRVDHLTQSWFDNRTLGCFPGTPRTLYESAGQPPLWAAAHNRFFTLAVMSPIGTPGSVPLQAQVAPVNLDWSAKNGQKMRGFESALVYRGGVLGAAGTNRVAEHRLVFYTGPKEYNTLARLAVTMKNNVDYVMEFNGFFGFFSKMLLLSMNWLHDTLKLSYALAILAITLIIKLVFWPLTKASTRSMKRMAALQPEMNKIREKYKDDPQKMNRKMMEFMKEHKVSPLGGCLPMIIQIPVFFGFFFMIRSAIELRGASFLWAWDLSQADTVAHIAGIPINPLPIIMGLTMFWQSSLTPPSPGMDATSQKLMKYMPLMFFFILYQMSAGLTLYWTAQNLLTIAQTYMTKAADQTAGPGAAAHATTMKKK